MGFNLTTRASDSDEDLPEVCGFFFTYIFRAFPLKTNSYSLAGSDGILSETYRPDNMHNSTECQASGLSKICI